MTSRALIAVLPLVGLAACSGELVAEKSASTVDAASPVRSSSAGASSSSASGSGVDSGSSSGPRALLFGGTGDYGNKPDTWSWDGAQWTQLKVTAPPVRGSPLLAPLGGNLVLFGLGSASGGLNPYTATWAGTWWSSVTVPQPTPREGAAMAPLGDSLVLVGGCNPEADPASPAFVRPRR
jgi:hypothetical protein